VIKSYLKIKIHVIFAPQKLKLKTNMKKILAIVAVASVFSLTACNNTGSSTSAADSTKMADSAKMAAPAMMDSAKNMMDTAKKMLDTAKSKMGGK